MRKHSQLLHYFLIFLGIYVLLYGFYLLTSVGIPYKTIGLQSRRYLPCALAVTLSLYCWIQAKLPLKKLAPHFLISLLWYLVYPISCWLTFHLNTNFIDNHYDIAFAAYVFAFTVSLRLLLASNCHSKLQGKSDAFLVGLLHTALIILPLVQIWYFYTYQLPVTESGAMALLQTNPAEAREYLTQNLGAHAPALLIADLLVLVVVFYKLNKLELFTDKTPAKILGLIMVIVFSTGYYGYKIIPEVGVMNKYLNAKSYFELSAEFNKNHAGNFKNLQVTLPEKKLPPPSTIIMIIGESASRDYMSAYTKVEHDTTPWMREMSSQSDFILFRHAYSSWGQTVPSLERALTEKNQYNDREFNQSITMLDMAKKAGFTTYWFSNQGTMGGADTPITMVAKTADHSAWIEDTLANTSQMKYDGDLLPYLKQVDPQQNNFIVLHIMGSHDNYINRYPPEFTKWGEPNKFDFVVNYDNSIAYTDWFLKQVYQYGKDKLHLQALLYFSDHGADPRVKRRPGSVAFISLRIPMFLYLSETYQKLYPETAAVLRQHQDSYFTNDLMYETVCGILNLHSDHYDPMNSLASPAYKYTRDILTTNLGRNKLTEDHTDNQ